MKILHVIPKRTMSHNRYEDITLYPQGNHSCHIADMKTLHFILKETMSHSRYEDITLYPQCNHVTQHIWRYYTLSSRQPCHATDMKILQFILNATMSHNIYEILHFILKTTMSRRRYEDITLYPQCNHVTQQIYGYLYMVMTNMFWINNQ